MVNLRIEISPRTKMNDRYFGNIHDFCKYGLLRHMADLGFRLGICWMLTPAIGNPTGSAFEYLNSRYTGGLQRCDRKLFQWLLDQRDRFEKGEAGEWGVRMIETSGIIRGADYFGESMPAALTERRKYFNRMLHEFKYQPAEKRKEVVFLDPDFGVGYTAREFAGERGNGYLRADEIKRCFHAGFSVLFYQDWNYKFPGESAPVAKIRNALREEKIHTPILDMELDAVVEGQHAQETKGAKARFLLVQRPEHSVRMAEFVEKFRASPWCRGGPFVVHHNRIGLFIDVENAVSLGMPAFQRAFREAESLGDLQVVAIGKRKPEYRKILEFLSARGIEVRPVADGKNKADHALSAAMIGMGERGEVDGIVVVSNDGLFRADAAWAKEKKIRYIGIGRNPKAGYPELCDDFCHLDEDGTNVRWQSEKDGK